MTSSSARGLLTLLVAAWIVAAPRAASSAIDLDLRASRIDGAAPLAVQFNASGTRHSNANVDTFRQVFYEWDFGERAAGKNPGHWRHGISEALASPLSKDEDCCSAIAAHVYDAPGTYTAKVTARDRFGATATATVRITVRDPNSVWSGTSTVCVAATSGFSGCPSGARQVVTRDFDQALANSCGVTGNTPTRCLFRRGDTFVADRETRLGKGPHLVGAFGSGADPVVDHSNNDESSLITPTGDDVRVMNLRATRTRTADNTAFVRARTSTTANHVLIYKTRAEGSNQIFSSGTTTCDTGVNGHWFLVENEVGPTNYSNNGNGLMWAGRRQTIMGNYVHDNESSGGGGDGHEIRIQCLQDFYVGHNTVAPGPTGGAPFTIRAPRHDRDGGIGNLCAQNRDCVIPPDHPGCSQRNVISGNYINMDHYNEFANIVQGEDAWQGGAAGGFGLSSASFDGCIQDNVIERHYMKADQFSFWKNNSQGNAVPRGTKRGFGYMGRRATFRNMVFNFNKALHVEAVIRLNTEDGDSPSMNLRGNEAYDIHVFADKLLNPKGRLQGITMNCGPQISEISVHNFFMYAPGYQTELISAEGAACRVLAKQAVCSSDSSDPTRTCAVPSNPFAGPFNPDKLDSMLLRADSPLVDAGSKGGSLYGILGNRVTDGAPDIGAHEVGGSSVAAPLPPVLLTNP